MAARLTKQLPELEIEGCTKRGKHARQDREKMLLEVPEEG